MVLRAAEQSLSGPTHPDAADVVRERRLLHVAIGPVAARELVEVHQVRVEFGAVHSRAEASASAWSFYIFGDDRCTRMWGRLLTCGRMAIGLLTFVRVFSPNTHILFVATFHSRRLPHCYSTGQATFLTWRLHGSLPPNRSFASALPSGQAFVALDRLLDGTRTGPLFLHQPEVAKMVTDAIHYRDLRTYRLHAFVVMPSHVHLLMTPLVAVSQVMQSLKRFTAREANRLLGLPGQPFWQGESYDRLVRNETEFERIVHYIERNPVTAGLAATPENFPWSSARADCQSAAG
jgi:putative transposase